MLLFLLLLLHCDCFAITHCHCPCFCRHFLLLSSPLMSFIFFWLFFFVIVCVVSVSLAPALRQISGHEDPREYCATLHYLIISLPLLPPPSLSCSVRLRRACPVQAALCSSPRLSWQRPPFPTPCLVRLPLQLLPSVCAAVLT